MLSSKKLSLIAAMLFTLFILYDRSPVSLHELAGKQVMGSRAPKCLSCPKGEYESSGPTIMGNIPDIISYSSLRLSNTLCKVEQGQKLFPKTPLNWRVSNLNTISSPKLIKNTESVLDRLKNISYNPFQTSSKKTENIFENLKNISFIPVKKAQTNREKFLNIFKNLAYVSSVPSSTTKSLPLPINRIWHRVFSPSIPSMRTTYRKKQIYHSIVSIFWSGQFNRNDLSAFLSIIPRDISTPFLKRVCTGSTRSRGIIPLAWQTLGRFTISEDILFWLLPARAVKGFEQEFCIIQVQIPSFMSVALFVLGVVIFCRSVYRLFSWLICQIIRMRTRLVITLKREIETGDVDSGGVEGDVEVEGASDGDNDDDDEEEEAEPEADDEAEAEVEIGVENVEVEAEVEVENEDEEFSITNEDEENIETPGTAIEVRTPTQQHPKDVKCATEHCPTRPRLLLFKEAHARSSSTISSAVDLSDDDFFTDGDLKLVKPPFDTTATDDEEWDIEDAGSWMDRSSEPDMGLVPGHGVSIPPYPRHAGHLSPIIEETPSEVESAIYGVDLELQSNCTWGSEQIMGLVPSHSGDEEEELPFHRGRRLQSIAYGHSDGPCTPPNNTSIVVGTGQRNSPHSISPTSSRSSVHTHSTYDEPCDVFSDRTTQQVQAEVILPRTPPSPKSPPFRRRTVDPQKLQMILGGMEEGDKLQRLERRVLSLEQTIFWLLENWEVAGREGIGELRKEWDDKAEIRNRAEFWDPLTPWARRARRTL
ncbi:hypothetical protein M422DRAFT_46887 [Sphaerobolus stellatus SS14]|uniref:Uncharacterized protein n=1 Tax=Sphaerobolus stellatus (strain SS14) TaxID=990650 RepID=A0A0C9W266_SPHS4|nr:hypothetical protein M422DRAFT_46887 [Sphaerobolus stellatus SS14]